MKEYKISDEIIGELCRAINQFGKNKDERCSRKFKCKGYFCNQHYKAIYQRIHKGGNCS